MPFLWIRNINITPIYMSNLSGCLSEPFPQSVNKKFEFYTLMSNQINSIWFCCLNNIWIRQKRILHFLAKIIKLITTCIDNIKKGFSAQLFFFNPMVNISSNKNLRDEKLAVLCGIPWLILWFLVRTFLELIQLS